MNSEGTGSPLPEHGAAPEKGVRWVFLGPNGIRAGWRLALYAVLVVVCFVIFGLAARILHILPSRQPTEFTPFLALANDSLFFAGVFLPAVVMKFIEKRAVADYGLPWRNAFGKNFWVGMFWGLVLLSLVIGGMAAFRGYEINSVALAGSAIFKYGALWFVAFIAVGFAEEFSFRGYTQYTLASGIRFWPAAVLLSAGFGALHLTNGGEGLVGAAEVFLVAMFFCLTLRRTGNLWFAIGMHASFDWGETFLYSTSNSGMVATGHLLNISYHGSHWVTGGTVGPEGTVFCLLFTGLAIVVFARFYPASKKTAGSASLGRMPSIG